MLSKIGSLAGLLGPKIDHPLADSKELRRILAELPLDNGFKALDEIAGWLESLLAASDFPPDLLFEVVRQLDEAAQFRLRRLSRDYLQVSRPSKDEEKRLWNMIRGVWHHLASNYERCLDSALAKGKPADIFKASLPLLCARLIVSLGAVNKWDYFHYGPLPASLWSRLGRACLVAEEAGVATHPLQLYPQQSSLTTVVDEYLKVMVFQSASMDCLRPLEIELAEKLIAHFLPKFVFGPEARTDSVYWVDLAKDQPPMRLARMPQDISPSLRFFQPGDTQAELESLAREIENSGDVPTDLNLGGQYQARTLLPALKHLAAYLAPVPPQRRHVRHRVKHRVAVLNGLENALVLFSKEQAGNAQGLQVESWVVDNVSMGGLGAVVNTVPAEWLKVGALLSLQPDGGDNWLLGIVRRCYRDTDGEIRVGVQSIARQLACVELQPLRNSDHANAASVAALWLQDSSESEEMRFVLPTATFDLQENMALELDGQRLLLIPVALAEQSAGYEVARYRTQPAE